MIQYIDKSAVVAEIERSIANYKKISVGIDKKGDDWVDSVSMLNAKIDVLQHTLSYINTLEAKEVDLEKEIKCFTMSKELYEADSVIKAVAKHFFELGLNTRKI